MFTANDTKLTARSEMQKSCTLLPTTKVQDECYKMIDSFAPLMIQHVGDMLRKDEVCTSLGMCARDLE